MLDNNYLIGDLEELLVREAYVFDECLYSPRPEEDEFEDLLLDWYESWDAIGHGLRESSGGQIIGGHRITTVEDHGGEGQGDERFIVFRVENPDTGVVRYFQRSGYYSSYDGSNWEDGSFREVEPREVTRIEYFDIPKK